MNNRFRAAGFASLLMLTSQPLLAQPEGERIEELEQRLNQQQQLIVEQQRVLQELRGELDALKQQQSNESAIQTEVLIVENDTAVVVEPQPVQRSWTENIEIYGFAMADMIYDAKRVDPDWEDTLRVSTIPTADGQFGPDGNFVFSVRQSRLGIKSSWDTSFGEVTALLESELFGVGEDAGQTTPRLRHAWATVGNFGMGQYWSNFMDADVFPNTIDYWGPTGMVFYRNKQARYTIPLDNGEFAIALEDPDTALDVGKFRDECIDPVGESCESTFGDVFNRWNNVPDVSIRYRAETDWGHWQLAGIGRKLGFERRDTQDRDYELGWGLNASTVVRTTERDQLKLQLVYGEGIGNYLNDGGVDLAPRLATVEGNEAVAVPLLGIVAYYDHYWNDKWSSSVGWSTTRLDTTAGQADNEFKNGQIAQINLLHYPTEGVLMGGELIWGEREDIDGASFSDVRAQFSVKVNFPRP
ncbi:MAG: porin [Halieaceae bacterium]|nr:porin [Halieaceae bacterium]